MLSIQDTTGQNGGKRHYMRHPSAMPIACKPLAKATPPNLSDLYNVSLGGLSFLTNREYRKGDALEVSFPSLRRDEVLHGVVVWIQDMGEHPAGRYACGVQFSDNNTHFRARLVEQICHIEAYRLAQMKYGRALTSPQASEEWVTKFAHRFQR